MKTATFTHKELECIWRKLVQMRNHREASKKHALEQIWIRCKKKKNSTWKLIIFSKKLCLEHLHNTSRTATTTSLQFKCTKSCVQEISHIKAWELTVNGKLQVAQDSTWRHRTYLFVYPKSLTKGTSKTFANWRAEARNLEY